MVANLPFNYKVYAKKGKFYVVISYKDGNGKYKKKWIRTGLDEGTKKKEVNTVADQIVAEYYSSMGLEGNVIDASISIPSTSSATIAAANAGKDLISFFDFIDKWLEYKKPRVSKFTYQCYCSGIKDVKSFFAGKELYIQNIKPLDILEYYNSIIQRGCLNLTVKNRHLCLHNVFEYAVRLDLIPFNPTTKIELPKVKKHEATFYSKSELDSLFKAFLGDRIELVVHIAAYYGLRRSEILGLQWDAISFEQKTLTVCRKVITCLDENGTYKTICEEELKTNATRRTLPLIPHIKNAVKKKRITGTF